MKYRRKTNKRTIWRKELNDICSVKEWSRMLHKWWKRDVLAKKEFKKEKEKLK